MIIIGIVRAPLFPRLRTRHGSVPPCPKGLSDIMDPDPAALNFQKVLRAGDVVATCVALQEMMLAHVRVEIISARVVTHERVRQYCV